MRMLYAGNTVVRALECLQAWVVLEAPTSHDVSQFIHSSLEAVKIVAALHKRRTARNGEKTSSVTDLRYGNCFVTPLFR